MTDEQLEQFIAQYKRDELHSDDNPAPPVPVSKVEEEELEALLNALGDEAQSLSRYLETQPIRRRLVFTDAQGVRNGLD